MNDIQNPETRAVMCLIEGIIEEQGGILMRRLHDTLRSSLGSESYGGSTLGDGLFEIASAVRELAAAVRKEQSSQPWDGNE